MLKLKEDIIIPKGTEFSFCMESRSSDVYITYIGMGMINSTISIHVPLDALEEIGEKFSKEK